MDFAASKTVKAQKSLFFHKDIELTLMLLNSAMPILRLVVALIDISCGAPLSFIYISVNITAAIFTTSMIVLYLKKSLPLEYSKQITIETSGIAVLCLAFFEEPHLNLVWVTLYLYLTFLVQIPKLNSCSGQKYLTYIKPLLIICFFGLWQGMIILKSHTDIFAVIAIASFLYLAALVHSSKVKHKKHILQKIKEAEQQLKTVISAVPVGILVMTENNSVKIANSYACCKFQCSDNEQLTHKIREVTYKPGAKGADSSEDFLHKDLTLYLKSCSVDLVTFGQIEVADKCLSVIGNKTTWGGQPAIVVVIKDVTEVIQLERTQSESQFKNVMLRSVSHELKTPTNGILHSVQAVASGEDVPEWAKKRLSIAEVSCKHLLMLIYDLLDYSQLIAGKFRLQKCLFNLRKTLTDSVELMRLIAEKKHIHLVTHIDPLLPEEVFSDANRLSQVLLNFLSNGVKFTPREGKIEVSAVLNNYCQMELSVSDTGVGIPPNQIDNLFKAFSRSDTTASINPQGVGLGLHISNMLAKQLGNSSVTVESKLAEGSRFKCIVNIYEKSRSSLSFYDEENPTVDDCMPLANKVYYFRNKESNLPRILVVDDSPFNRSVISDILNSVCIECAECDTGIEAIDYILSRAKRNCPIELVLMDFEMPLMNGPTTCKVILEKLKEQSLPVPTIIAHSAYSSEDDINLCKEAGMLDFLPKPSSKQEILAKLKLYL
mmetsp:Transcript_25826/g.45564  ORF Transcript_25826/g.45564 Transcript_25826/m.45564 type:complete len:716 (+) Transcript_25826:17-2164(+)